jgi:hypothetical protein
VLHSLSRWESGGATIGGASAKGHGRLALAVWFDPTTGFGELTPEMEAEAVAAYLESLRTNREEGTAFLHSLYAVPAEAESDDETGEGGEAESPKPKRRGRPRKAKAVEEPAVPTDGGASE